MCVAMQAGEKATIVFVTDEKATIVFVTGEKATIVHVIRNILNYCCV